MKAIVHMWKPILSFLSFWTPAGQGEQTTLLQSTKKETTELNQMILRQISDLDDIQKQVGWSREWEWGKEEKYYLFARPSASNQPSFGHILGTRTYKGGKTILSLVSATGSLGKIGPNPKSMIQTHRNVSPGHRSRLWARSIATGLILEEWLYWELQRNKLGGKVGCTSWEKMLQICSWFKKRGKSKRGEQGFPNMWLWAGMRAEFQ